MKLVLLLVICLASTSFAKDAFKCEILKLDKGNAIKIAQIKVNPLKGEWTAVRIGNGSRGIFCGSLGLGFGCELSDMKTPGAIGISSGDGSGEASSTVVVESKARMLDYIVREGNETFEASCKR